MSFLTIFKVSLRSLGRNPVRSFLSCLGIGIGIVAVILAMAIGEGAKTMMVKEISSDRKSTRLNSSHPTTSRMPSSA